MTVDILDSWMAKIYRSIAEYPPPDSHSLAVLWVWISSSLSEGSAGNLSIVTTTATGASLLYPLQSGFSMRKAVILVVWDKLKSYMVVGKCIHFKSVYWVPEGNDFTHQLPVCNCHLFPNKGRSPKMFIIYLFKYLYFIQFLFWSILAHSFFS